MKNCGILLIAVLVILSAGLSGCDKISGKLKPPEYSLTINPGRGGGHVTPEFGTHIYKYHQEVTVTATPDPGWVFDGWLGDWVYKSGSTWLDPTIIVLMDRNRTITANFKQVQ